MLTVINIKGYIDVVYKKLKCNNGMQDERITAIFDFIGGILKSPRAELDYGDDVQCLIAIMLSAQCTDVRVNLVTPELFARYKNLQDYATADREELEQLIYSTGFYRNKARNIVLMAQTVIKYYGGVIPSDVEKLVKLPGVGRKTASVFAEIYHNVPAIGVDTHVGRVSRRFGFTTATNPDVVERDLKEIFEQKNWGKYSLLMVLFGRYYCRSQHPICATIHGMPEHSCTENQ